MEGEEVQRKTISPKGSKIYKHWEVWMLWHCVAFPVLSHPFFILVLVLEPCFHSAFLFISIAFISNLSILQPPRSLLGLWSFLSYSILTPQHCIWGNEVWTSQPGFSFHLWPHLMPFAHGACLNFPEISCSFFLFRMTTPISFSPNNLSAHLSGASSQFFLDFPG